MSVQQVTSAMRGGLHGSPPERTLATGGAEMQDRQATRPGSGLGLIGHASHGPHWIAIAFDMLNVFPGGFGQKVALGSR